ncbi:hypothetical protein BDK51DRAFT_47508 [Blyttiomyces helicus]|uniref:Uncharacterized protein n=1 Tax=Blyttiomyces helicus TaxID=388810 RepID=A0A4P9W3W0_9FUNG|nr:hypothetical protein BDK51DRAFT_47508 [Blyttiomyces helicus]|eukprot:RKO87019.1 hypothetical protein BDK51DRAFT_47508 [Blyttiomyces helicus]
MHATNWRSRILLPKLSQFRGGSTFNRLALRAPGPELSAHQPHLPSNYRSPSPLLPRRSREPSSGSGDGPRSICKAVVEGCFCGSRGRDQDEVIEGIGFFEGPGLGVRDSTWIWMGPRGWEGMGRCFRPSNPLANNPHPAKPFHEFMVTLKAVCRLFFPKPRLPSARWPPKTIAGTTFHSAAPLPLTLNVLPAGRGDPASSVRGSPPSVPRGHVYTLSGRTPQAASVGSPHYRKKDVWLRIDPRQSEVNGIKFTNDVSTVITHPPGPGRRKLSVKSTRCLRRICRDLQNVASAEGSRELSRRPRPRGPRILRDGEVGCAADDIVQPPRFQEEVGSLETSLPARDFFFDVSDTKTAMWGDGGKRDIIAQLPQLIDAHSGSAATSAGIWTRNLS